MFDARAKELIELTNKKNKGYHGYIEVDGIKYYIKPEMTIDMEMIAEKLASKIGLHCAHYKKINVNNNSYLITEDLNNKGSFTLTSKYIKERPSYNKGEIEKDSLYSIWTMVENKYPKYIRPLMNDIIKMYIFDIFMLISDRHDSNWGFIENEDGVTMYIIDNELALMGIKPVSKYSTYTKLKYKSITEYENRNAIGVNMKNLEYFINTSSEEYLEMLNSIYNTLTPDYFEKVITDIEKEYGINSNKETYIKAYTENYDAITSLLHNRGLK